MVPKPSSMAEMRTAEYLDKANKGPVVMMTVMPNGAMTLGSSLLQWFVYVLGIGVLTAFGVRSGALIFVWAFLSVLLVGAILISRWWLRVESEHSPARRAFLHAAQAALLVTPTIVTGYAVFIERVNISLREQDLMFSDLTKDLDGLRVVQLTDIHLSPFLSERELARAVDMANETHAHLALVTGDLISTARDPLDICLKQLARLRADAGIYGCLGNHEMYENAED